LANEVAFCSAPQVAPLRACTENRLSERHCVQAWDVRCTPFRSADGTVSGFICGSRQRAPKCSTPGCNRSADLECDAPVERNGQRLPRRGDARLHREHSVVFYVWRLVSVEGVDHVEVSTAQPGHHGTRQTVSVDDWFRKTTATCDRPVCCSCAVRSGTLDLCAAHGRQLTAEASC
jgi:hypothetical protein